MSRSKTARTILGTIMILFIMGVVALDISPVMISLEKWHIVTLLGAALTLLGVDRAIENFEFSVQASNDTSDENNGS